ncbi:hypothetical protein RN001_004257 [Aquatica leii]|uniref:Carboxylic ester hydrolase n=1 Tax=Aquatica leii TaxID=1421715 RepID=A0AAN7QJF4_9COLE|nr:hypothetical protein RN001_004257 [Aquatica leii]
MSVLSVVLVFMCATLIRCNDEHPIVETPFGKIVGTYASSYSGRKYAEYLSIPYAKPPVGDLRFMDPEPNEPWVGIWHANFSTECAQLRHSAESGGFFTGDEDCLYLSIFVPEIATTGKKSLDVFFDIHGGGFNFGSSSDYAGPEVIMDKDVIFAKINYRLGVLGFLSTEDEIVPGNAGMKDQVLAIKWVKDNIKYFGGNPKSIILTGLSAGGASVHSHYLSPMSKGLFKAGISVSGNVLCPWVMQENALEKTREVASAVGCTQKTNRQLIDCLKSRPIKQIVDSMRIHRAWLFNPFSTFGLVVEKHGKQRFMPEHPLELLKKGKIQNLPWLTSTVKHEGLYPVADFVGDANILKELENNWNELLPLVLHYKESVSPDKLSSVSQAIKAFYFKDRPLDNNTIEELIQMASDRLFNVDVDKSMRLQAKANTAPTYYYYFTYVSDEVYTFTDLWTNLNRRVGVCHGDDLAFIFYKMYAPLKKYTDNDERMKDILLNIWTSFAKTGNPEVAGVKWKAVSKNLNDDINYLHISSPHNIKMKKINEIGHRSFWDSLPFEENEKLVHKYTKNEL